MLPELEPFPAQILSHQYTPQMPTEAEKTKVLLLPGQGGEALPQRVTSLILSHNNQLLAFFSRFGHTQSTASVKNHPPADSNQMMFSWEGY